MTAGPLPAQRAGGVELLERAMGYTLGSLLLVTQEALSNPTPCDRWDLRHLLVHMNESLATLDEAISLGSIDLDPPGPVWLGPDSCGSAAALVGTLRDRACTMMGAWAGTGHPWRVSVADRDLPAQVVAATGALEIAVHGWDVARACGRDRPLPAGLAAELLPLSELFIPDRDRPTRFAPRVDLVGPARAGERLLAVTGRDPR